MIVQEPSKAIVLRFDNGRAFRLWVVEGGTGSVVIEKESGEEIDRLGADALVEFLYLESIKPEE